MLRWYAIQGSSLEPEFCPGDYALAASLPGWRARLKPGDVVVCQAPAYGILVKRVEHISTDGQQVRVIGTHPQSIDSRIFGALPRNRVLGKVVWHVRKKARTDTNIL